MKTVSSNFAFSLALMLAASGCARAAGDGPVTGGTPGDEEGSGGAPGAGGGASGSAASGGAGGGAGQSDLDPDDLLDSWGAPSTQTGTQTVGCGAPVFAGIVRDFRAYEGGLGHPDFQVYTGAGLKGIVQGWLDEDHKPLYAHAGPTEMTSGKEAFDQWFRDVDGVNIPLPLTLTPEIDDQGVATYTDITFFPIDDQGWGNELYWHNFHFTFELHMSFVYKGGEVFSFAGDDDLWVFANGRLAIDLGGVHEAQADTLDLDARAAELGLVIGEEYPLDLFQAERHTTESKFKIQTTLEFTNCDPILY